jgi:hypothetical protein
MSPASPFCGSGGFQPAGFHPDGGKVSGSARGTVMRIIPIPKIRKVVMIPYAEMKYPARFAVINAEKPTPNTDIPTASPRRSGNHRAAMATVAPYTIPTPIPPITPNRMESIVMDVTIDASSQPSPVSIHPVIVTSRGPRRSTYVPVRAIVIAKTARNNENGISTSFAVTAWPRSLVK